MAELHIHWKIERMDEGDEPDPRFAECLLEVVRAMADPRIGLVLLDSHPLQHLPHGYDDFDDEVRDLPWNSPAEDQEALIRHFSTWGMQRLSGTRFMIAAPETLRDARTPQWPPCPILDRWNSCIVCGEWVDLEAGEGRESDDGPIHKDCE